MEKESVYIFIKELWGIEICQAVVKTEKDMLFYLRTHFDSEFEEGEGSVEDGRHFDCGSVSLVVYKKEVGLPLL